MKFALLIPVLLTIGLGTGLLIRPSIDTLIHGTAATHDHLDDHDDHDDHERHEEVDDHAELDEHDHEEDHLGLSREAFQNLQLSVAPVQLSDYVQTLRMPGEIIESPGLSGQHVVAPVDGVLTKLFVSPGVSVAAGDPLFELRITDQQLRDAQLKFLDLLTQREIVAAERARIAPLAAAGSVAGRKTIELEYELKKLDASIDVVEQGLALNGLSREQIYQIKRTQRLITELVVHAPEATTTLFDVRGKAAQSSESEMHLVTWSESSPPPSGLTVEQLHVQSGQSVPQGEEICSLATHSALLVRGHAFENEANLVSELCGTEETVAVEFGIEGHNYVQTGLSVQYVSNHVDEHSQSFRFFIPLANQVLRESRDSHGRLFRSWRYKVGQRVYVVVPTEEFRDQIVLPRSAVVQEGPDAFVFRQHIEDHSEAHEHEEEIFIEFEPVPVAIVSKDKHYVVIEAGGQLSIGDSVAQNSAYQLLLAMKAQAEGGGGHHHHHH